MSTIDNSMEGRICMVTGGTGGLGLVTARSLAQMGAEVVIVGRNPEHGAAALEHIKRETDSDRVRLLLADLSSQAEVRRLAEAFRAIYDQLHVLVNNAGAFFNRWKASIDGIEMTFALNHLGYFLLTNLLMDPIKAAAEPDHAARVINMSSIAHRYSHLKFNDLQNKHPYVPWVAYGRSKLANIYFTTELARRTAGENITANALHPGFVDTGFGHTNKGILRSAIRLTQILGISVEEGAQTGIYLATSPDVEDVSGQYFKEMRVVKPSRAARDILAALRLWEASAALTGL